MFFFRFYTFLFFIVGVGQSLIYANDSIPRTHEKKDRKVRYSAIVLPARTPENGWYAQGGVMAVFKTNHRDSALRASNLYLFGLYSQLRQYRVSVGGDIFTPKEKWYFNFWHFISYYPDYYYGVGAGTTPTQRELVNYDNKHLGTNIYRKVAKHTFVGLGHLYESIQDLSYPANGLMATDPPVGFQGYRISGLGPKLRYDARDNILSTIKGAFAELSWQTFQPWLGSTVSFNAFYTDLRYFKELRPNTRHIVALQYYYSYTDGEVPFRQLSNINTRAYHPNIYKDIVSSWIQGEYRFPIWKFIGASVFGGGAIVASANDKWFAQGVKPNAGVGVRFRVIPQYNMNMRIEYGIGKETSSLYIAFYDAF